MAKIPGNPEDRKYTIQHLWQKHHEIKRLKLLGMGNIEIARALNCTPQNISDISNSPIFQAELQILATARDSASVDVARAIISEGPKSLELLSQIRDNKIDGEHAPLVLRAKVAADLLDRNPRTAKARNISGSILHGHIVQGEVLSRIKQRAIAARESAVNDGAVIVDAEIVQEEVG